MRAKHMAPSTSLLLSLLGTDAFAPAGASIATASDVIVTGTRTRGSRVYDGLAPVQALGQETLATVAQPALVNALVQIQLSMKKQNQGVDLAKRHADIQPRGLMPNLIRYV